MNEYLRIKDKSQRLIDAARERANKLRPRDITVFREADYRLDPVAVRESLRGIVVKEGQIVRVLG